VNIGTSDAPLGNGRARGRLESEPAGVDELDDILNLVTWQNGTASMVVGAFDRTIPTSLAWRNDDVTVLLHFYAMWTRRVVVFRDGAAKCRDG
jgi:hypothetical protein